LVFGVFSEHALSILNFFGFDEGTTLFAVESCIGSLICELFEGYY